MVSTMLPPRQNPARASLVDVAYEAIAEAIFDRRIEPGARLRIDALAGELGMSITPIREALARTAAAGLTKLDVNRGYTVAPLLDPAAFHQLFSARRAIESAAVRGDARSPGAWVGGLAADQVRPLRSQLATMARAGRGRKYADYSRFSRLDHALHLRLIELAGNPFLVTAFQSLNFHLHMSRLYSGAGVIDYEVAHAEHAEIVQALENHDGQAAWTACRNHMQRAERRLRVLLG
jgi:DNA-binding GntR family transcriptional regulator